MSPFFLLFLNYFVCFKLILINHFREGVNMKKNIFLLFFLLMGDGIIAKNPNDIKDSNLFKQCVFEAGLATRSIELLVAYEAVKEYAESPEGKNDKAVQAAYKAALQESATPEDAVQKIRREITEKMKRDCVNCKSLEEFSQCAGTQATKVAERSKWTQLMETIFAQMQKKHLSDRYK